MDVDALRTWGIATSAALIAGALAISLTAQPPAARAQGVIEVAQTEEAQALSFVVRFRGGGPIARAQAQAAAGQVAQAQRQVERQLRRQRAFAGLCFDRFTVGAAEIVVRTCEAVAAGERQAIEQSWLTRLRAMRSVAYVDTNRAAAPARAG